MPDALTAPFMAAALVLFVAGIAKLRSPGPAARALLVLGVPGRRRAVRWFASFECVLALACLIRPGVVIAAATACVYAAFAVISFILARRRASCGCFGAEDAPVTTVQSAMSIALAVVAATAALWQPQGVGWMLGRSPGFAAVFAIGVAGSAYAIVLTYTVLPHAWGAWDETAREGAH